MVTEAIPRSGPDRETQVMDVPAKVNFTVSFAFLLARYAPPFAEGSVYPTHPSYWTPRSLSSTVEAPSSNSSAESSSIEPLGG